MEEQTSNIKLNPKQIVLYFEERDLLYFSCDYYSNEEKNICSYCESRIRRDFKVEGGTTFVAEDELRLFFMVKILCSLGYNMIDPCLHRHKGESPWLPKGALRFMTDYPLKKFYPTQEETCIQNIFQEPMTDLDLKIEEINKKFDKLDERITDVDDIISAPNGPRACMT